ncbi:MAG: hypothetical protein EU535_08320 [Promethearchaeota archaeon]|nr:MAG: hypothetical protein EU535_08320 [Candidatus Lokiarchaeota archaeon]
MINIKRIGLATVLGAVLGIFCILGAGGRVGGWIGNEILLIGLWYNRVIMGVIIGFAGDLELIKSGKSAKWGNPILRGIILGLLVSLQFYLSTSFLDLLTFLAGIMYGIIIDLVSTLLTQKS